MNFDYSFKFEISIAMSLMEYDATLIPSQFFHYHSCPSIAVAAAIVPKGGDV